MLDQTQRIRRATLLVWTGCFERTQYEGRVIPGMQLTETRLLVRGSSRRETRRKRFLLHPCFFWSDAIIEFYASVMGSMLLLGFSALAVCTKDTLAKAKQQRLLFFCQRENWTRMCFLLKANDFPNGFIGVLNIHCTVIDLHRVHAGRGWKQDNSIPRDRRCGVCG